MRIVLTVNYSPWSRYRGGGQRSTHFLASALAERGHHVSVVFTKPPWERVQTPSVPCRIVWASLYDMRSRRDAPLRSLTALPVASRVKTLGREGALDVVHAQGEEGTLVHTVTDCPLVLTPRYGSYPASVGPGPKSTFAHARAWALHEKFLMLGKTARRATLVCTTSRATSQLVQETFQLDPARLRVVPNGVDPVFLSVEREPRATDGPLLFFGRVETDKGIDVLLAAFAASKHRARTLHIVGEGSRVPYLQAELDTLLSDPERADAMGRAGRAHVRAQFSWDSVAAQLERVYAEAATLRAPQPTAHGSRS